MSVRRILLRRLRTDLIGPSFGESEKIEDRPSDRYLTGILFPQHLEMDNEEDDEQREVKGGKIDSTDNVSNENVSIFKAVRPATAGISFALSRENIAPGSINISVSAGQYLKEEVEQTGAPVLGNYRGLTRSAKGLEKSAVDEHEDANPKSSKKQWYWRRVQRDCLLTVKLNRPVQQIDLGELDSSDLTTIPGLAIFVKTKNLDDRIAVTVQAINTNKHKNSMTRDEIEQQMFFQFEMNVSVVPPTNFKPRPVFEIADDSDAKTSALIYRNATEFATGHTCSANWNTNNSGIVENVSTTWTPEQTVLSVSPTGDPIFKKTFEQRGLEFPTAQMLSKASKSELQALFSSLIDAYEYWLQQESTKIKELASDTLKNQAKYHLSQCQKALERMKFGASEIVNNDLVCRAFQCANAAMHVQAMWARNESSIISTNSSPQLEWRPFQLGFALLCVRSFTEPDHDDRSLLDLIWFPTGGGKTEAYLLVAAFLMFHRRLLDEEKTKCYGTNVLMRYTLRTLTIQQFQRAAALICACENVRKSSWNSDGSLGKQEFSIGLWVGHGSTPNDSETAISVLGTESESTPCQIEVCPACRKDLVWEPSMDRSRVICRCETDDCVLAAWDELPILTVDDQIYKSPPSLLIGTVDKFAQIVRKQEVGVLFGRGLNSDPPDLIIQDELHLISGPLGTLTGIYETVIDHLCTRDGIAPKIIGSTATIRRAEQQVNALFQRQAFQFPPPVIDHENSGFAKIDTDSNGRLYVGLTTVGRTDKYMMQAICASLLQAISDASIADDDKDPYGTLVLYFNSLRILGGALVAMQDDVPKAIDAIASRRSEQPRPLREPEELTSRKVSSEIPKVLRNLTIPFGANDCVDTLLASNMLSVGVDIPRLGLMVVNGQPKTISEYIQATSRVGRQQIPGLIVTIYNNNKPRDKAHYETFKTWHASLYRSIEATSVTPFASRARDKALHAALVGLARHLLPKLTQPKLSDTTRAEIEKEVLPIIHNRIENIDKHELESAKGQLRILLEEWEGRGDLAEFWNDYRPKTSLLISAEKAAARKESGVSESAAWETPNSMRNVEPGVDFKLCESVKNII